MFISLDGSGPLNQQIYDALRAAILSGRLEPGAKLPASRALARELNVSRTTVLLAYEQLLAEGYVTGRIGSGTFVSAKLPSLDDGSKAARAQCRQLIDTPRLSAYGHRINRADVLPPWSRTAVRYDFRYGLPPVEEFPHDLWRRLLVRRARAASLNTLSYGPPEGYEPLREAIASYLNEARGVVCRPEHVIIVNGSQQALDLTARVLIDPGDTVVIEEPHYQGARKVYQAAGAELFPTCVDAEGLDVAQLPAPDRRPSIAYVTPSHQFPTGAVLSLGRRLALLGWAEAAQTYIVEDDYDSEYRYEGRPVQAMQGLDHSNLVIYTGTFSKVLYPALRIGYIVPPPHLIEPFVAAKWLTDRHTPTLEQQALSDFIREGHFARHLRRSRTRNAARRASLLDALDEHFGDRVDVWGANAGIHLIAWFRDLEPGDVEPLVVRARAAGVGLYSVAPYYLSPPSRAGLLMGFAPLNERDIRKGVKALATLVKDR